MTTGPSPQVTIEQLQRLLSDDTAFTKAYAFVVAAIAPGSCTLEVPHLPTSRGPAASSADRST